MIDLHCHILPGLDDGPDHWSKSLNMAKIAVRDGIKDIVCTPHWQLDLYPNHGQTIQAKVNQFRERLVANNIDLNIYPGSEIHVDLSVPAKLQSGEIITLNDTGYYALIELPNQVIPKHMEDFFWSLISREIIPIIAHPEKNIALSQDPDPLYEWVSMGAMIQITSSSLLGSFGKDPKDFAVSLLEHNLVHVLATDAHGPTKRPPKLLSGKEVVDKIKGQEIADKMVGEIPRQILQGEVVNLEEPIPFRNKKRSACSLKQSLANILKISFK